MTTKAVVTFEGLRDPLELMQKVSAQENVLRQGKGRLDSFTASLERVEEGPGFTLTAEATGRDEFRVIKTIVKEALPHGGNLQLVDHAMNTEI